MLDTFENQLKACKTLTEIKSALISIINQLGISTFSYTFYHKNPCRAGNVKFDFSSDNFKLWHKHYIAEGYEDVDTTMKSAVHSILPTCWDLQDQLNSAKTKRERQMRIDSIAFGAEKDVCIPVHGANEKFANLLIVQMKGEDCLKNWDEKRNKFILIAILYFDYLQAFLLGEDIKKNKYQLTKREQQCLDLIREQATIAEMAKTLNITERTVNYHIQKMNKKLGVKNKYQAVIKATKTPD